MGKNLRSCCHKCKEKIFHFRMRESETILPFYKKHNECMKEDPNNVETFDDQMQEKEWMGAQSEYRSVMLHKTSQWVYEK